MKIKQFVLGEFEVNNFLIKKGTEAILIDAGSPVKEIINYINQYNINLKAILLTHTHLDHISGLNELRKTFNIPVYVHEKEQPWLTDPSLNGSDRYPNYFGKIRALPAEYTFNHVNESKTIMIEPFQIEVISTPGHTPGGVSYYIKPWLFSGDTLFNNSIGRTDLYGGSLDHLKKSIKDRLYTLPDETIIYPGHGEKSQIKREKAKNPFVRL